MIVCKFGGSSTASPKAVTNIKKIAGDKRRKIFVFSAIGKSTKNDKKITDLLFEFCKEKKYIKKQEIINKIKLKFDKLTNLLHVNMEFSEIFSIFFKNKNKNYIISRGEYFTAQIMSKYLKIKYVPAEYVICFKNGVFDEKTTAIKTKKFLKKYGRFCTGGFYGYDYVTREIVLFERGGGDITGAILAKATNAKTYENYTDVCGVKMANPNVVDNPKTIKKLSYKQMMEIASNDGKVLHMDVCKILENAKEKKKIKNTFCPNGKSTMIDNKKHKVKFLCFQKQSEKMTIFVYDNESKKEIKCEEKDFKTTMREEYEKLIGG